MFLFTVGTTSCLLDQEGSPDFNDSPNVLGFSGSTQTVTFFVDNGDQQVPIPVRIDGPQKYDINSTVTATVSVDASSTAVEGTHFEIGDPTVTLSQEGNLLDVFDLTIKTDGIDPLTITENPKLVLKLDNISDSSILVNGRAETITIEILYICPSDLAGDYSNPDVPNCSGSDPITVEVVGDGRYKVSSVSNLQWTSGDCIYFYMIDNCGQLTYDSGDLDENGYATNGEGVVNPDGSFDFTYRIPSLGMEFSSTYSPL